MFLLPTGDQAPRPLLWVTISVIPEAPLRQRGTPRALPELFKAPLGQRGEHRSAELILRTPSGGEAQSPAGNSNIRENLQLPEEQFETQSPPISE